MDMTAAQLRLFTEAADRAHRLAMAEDLANLRAATQYDEKAFTKYLKTLDP